MPYQSTVSSRDSFSVQWDDFIRGEEWKIDCEPRQWFNFFAFLYRHKANFWTVRLLNRWENVMARKAAETNGKTAAPTQKGSWTNFTNIPVAAEQAADIFKVYNTAEVTEAALSELLYAGYRVSFSYSNQTDAVTASVTCKAAGDPNEGMTFTSFADTWYQALCVALYKHYVISGKVWVKGTGQAARPTIG